MNVVKFPKTEQSLHQTSSIDQSQPMYWVDQELDQKQVTKIQSRKRLTVEQLYTWGLRSIASLIVSSILFVAAIYYGVINP
jgi:hypothetical protein